MTETTPHTPNRNSAHTFKRIAIMGTIVTGAAQAIKVLSQLAFVIILTRILSPDDFGLVASVTPIILFVMLFQDVGVSVAIVQRDTTTPAQLNSMFWISLLIGIFSTLVIFLWSPAVSWFYHDSRLTTLTMFAALPLAFYSISAVPMAMLNRQMRFTALAITETGAIVTGYLVAILAGVMGAGYWSIALAPVVSSGLTLGAAFYATGWKPDRPRFWLERDIFTFGIEITASRVIDFFAQNVDKILIGRIENLTQLGYYDRAFRLLLFPVSAVIYPLKRVAWPILSRMKDDPARFRTTYLRASTILSFLLIPGIGAVAMTAEETILFLFGEKWANVAPLFMWLAIGGMTQPILNTISWIYVPLGKSRELLWWGTLNTAITCTAFVAGVFWNGALGVAIAFAAISIGARLPLAAWHLNRHTPITWKDVLANQLPYFAATGLTWLILAQLPIAGLWRTTTAIILSYLLSTLCLATLPSGREDIREGWKIGKGIIKSRLQK